MGPVEIKSREQADTPDINVPRKGFIPAINYWRALQILKQTPFKELWAKAREEAPHLLAFFLVLAACLFSVAFTVCWFIKKAIELVYAALKNLVLLVIRR